MSLMQWIQSDADLEQLILTRLRMQGGQGTASDLHIQSSNPNSIGAAFSSLAAKGLIERVMIGRSSRPSSHGGILWVWRIKETD
jgi:hypothetical protein